MNPYDAALAAVAEADGSAGLFPGTEDEAARRYRRLALLLHPDTAPAGRRPESDTAFARLSALWRGRSGSSAATVTTRNHTYVLGDVMATGDLAVLRRAVCDRDVLLKIPREPRDNDLLEQEADALRRLNATGDPAYRAYAPRLVETFRHRGPDGAERRVNVLEPLDGFHTLAEVGEAHPGGLDPRDAAWMWRRLLVALGWAHRTGLVHGAVLPEHVLVHPGEHGLVLVDWCYSVERGDTVPALVERHRGLYPAEVTSRRPATEATDLYMAARCMELLTGERTPRPLRAFVRGCTLPSETRRPHDAWRLLAEFDEILGRLYGPRTFRPFVMPAG